MTPTPAQYAAARAKAIELKNLAAPTFTADPYHFADAIAEAVVLAHPQPVLGEGKMTSEKREGPTIERDWTTKAGFRAVVLMGSMGHRCGYVGLPSGHPLHGKDYSESCDALLPLAEDETIGKRGIIPLLCASVNGGFEAPSPDVAFDVHGGITYAGGSEDYPVASDGLWWFGYDCGHAGDAKSPEKIAEDRARWPDKPFMWREDGEHRSLEYCEQECESLAEQMVSRVRVSP